MMAYLPIETVIRERQDAYYAALAAADQAAKADPFIPFMLQAIRDSLNEAAQSDQASDQVSDQVAALLELLKDGPLSTPEIMQKPGLNHRPSFRQRYLTPALEANLIERTLPHKPSSPKQKYRLSPKI